MSTLAYRHRQRRRAPQTKLIERDRAARRVGSIRDIAARVLARTVPRGVVLHGEALCKRYMHEGIKCDCPPEGDWRGLPTIPIARGAGYDRCLRCNTVWVRKVYVWEPHPIIVRGLGRKPLLDLETL